jgi:monoamine oxidase
MSYLLFKGTPPETKPTPPARPNMRKALSAWLIKNYGSDYQKTLLQQRSKNVRLMRKTGFSLEAKEEAGQPVVGIVGGGFAGMYAGLILQSLGIEFEIFESSDRVGGRIKTWYSTDYNEKNKDKACLYGEVGGMRLPQFAPDMLPVQQLALGVNAVLERNKLEKQKVYWRKFFYNSPVQRMRFNNMEAPIIAKNAAANSLNFGKADGGDLDKVWVTKQKGASGTYLPVNMIMDMVNTPFINAINKNFEKGFEMLMQYDEYSMWGYLTNVFTLGQLGEYYQEEMGPKKANIPWAVASYLETTSVGSGMFAVSFVEMVLAAYDWGGSKDPYRPNDPNVYMLTVNQGMQHFPDACHTVLNLEQGVQEADGQLAQVQLGILPNEHGMYSYNPPNLTEDAQPLPPDPPIITKTKKLQANLQPELQQEGAASRSKQRVFLNHKVVDLQYDGSLYNGQGGMKMKLVNAEEGKKEKVKDKQYPYVISTIPFGMYMTGYPQYNLLNNISFAKAQAIRECNYMPSFKAFVTFKKNFWAELGERQGYSKDKGLGAASTDRPNRQIIYPSYGYEAKGGVLQIYCWAEDARRLGALSDEERVNECLKGIDYLYPDGDVYANFAGYKEGVTTKTWFWDANSGGGAFALFNPGQFKNMYATLLTPEFNGCLNIAGEACSVHHGWIVGALDSAYNAVYNILTTMGADDKIQQMEGIWSTLAVPNVEENVVVSK